jgi:hypothetical protein
MLSVSVMVFALFTAIGFFAESTGLLTLIDACFAVGAVCGLVWDLRYAWKHGFRALDRRVWKL